MTKNTQPSTRWGRLCGLEQDSQIKELERLLGEPELSAVPSDSKMPRYKSGVFQLVAREDGWWIHSRILRQWRRRNTLRFMADCDQPSDFRRKNPTANTIRHGW